jgi:5-methylcytosine-specific restriction enzyme A
MPRSVPEWVGRTDDARVPDRVKLRILQRQRDEQGRPICPDCGMPIVPGSGVEFDHEIPLIDGGRHAELNLRAVHRRCHKAKTAREALLRAENRAMVKSHYGLKEPSRGFYKPEGVKFDWKRGRYVRTDP